MYDCKFNIKIYFGERKERSIVSSHTPASALGKLTEKNSRDRRIGITRVIVKRVVSRRHKTRRLFFDALKASSLTSHLIFSRAIHSGEDSPSLSSTYLTQNSRTSRFSKTEGESSSSTSLQAHSSIIFPRKTSQLLHSSGNYSSLYFLPAYYDTFRNYPS